MALASLLVGAILLQLATWTGLIASDDLGYSDFAQQIAAGRFNLTYHHYAIRYSVLLPVAAVYRLLGVSEFTTVLIPLVASALSVPLLTLIGWRLFNLRTGIIAGVLYATFPVHLRYASILVPEPISGFLALSAIFVYLGPKGATERGGDLRFLLSGFLIGVGYLAKEPVALILPALLMHALSLGNKRGASALALGAACVVFLEVSYYWVFADDLLFRLHAMAQHDESPMVMAANSDLMYRLFKSYPRMMIIPNMHFGLHSISSLLLALIGALSVRDRRLLLLCAWVTVPWLYLNFGTSGFSEYIALPVAPRYIEMTYPPLFILAAHGVLKAPNLIPFRRIKAWTPVVLISVVSFAGIFSGFKKRGTDYRTAEVAVLRSVVGELERQGMDCLTYEVGGNDSIAWHRSIRILSGGNIQPCPAASEGLVLVEDSLGLPQVLRETTR